jgi:large subunit ribosomal protein L24
MKLIKGDQVKVTVGKDAGKTGEIEKVFSKEDKVTVSGVNQYKRHVKGRLPGQKSEIITITKPLSTSKVALICQKCKQPTRVGFKFLKDDKIRVCKKCNEEISEKKIK